MTRPCASLTMGLVGGAAGAAPTSACLRMLPMRPHAGTLAAGPPAASPGIAVEGVSSREKASRSVVLERSLVHLPACACCSCNPPPPKQACFY
eukprot:scaffold24321_cov23-Tisochrysis_lutea.AAC.1